MRTRIRLTMVSTGLLSILLVSSGCSQRNRELREDILREALREPTDATVLYFDPTSDDGDVELTLDLLAARLDYFGFHDLTYQVDLENGTVFIESFEALPHTLATAADFLAEPGSITFRPVLTVLLPGSAEPGSIEESFTDELTPADEADPTGEVIFAKIDDFGEEINRYRLGPIAVDGEVVQEAFAVQDGEVWLVQSEFDEISETKLADITEECFERRPTCPTGQLAIVLDDRVISEPTVNQPDIGSVVRISGLSGEAEARALAAVLAVDPPDESEANLIELFVDPSRD